ncbi:16S rRNA (cytosine(967)-C(5))-methyltransferase [Thermosipho ferrireducens]|uniref:16S rRNA (Cytosine(967)-C(5))-methyltransferase n=1 Tax=Thermosipho ferrireducens TaxID=2571116 RepID=A0ABX7S4R1_9BACT|nr:16S rRNA (cytosine(967)-C(5))-methyltransferase [Thermosipho ferrireducens]QTA37459.1 16S rRNA (cytosine(967)-C(5))-methyltransferase [Thermosipho ferrireducens]
MSDRYIAYRLLRKNFRGGLYGKDFREAFSYVEEKAFFKELVYGVLRRQEYLDWIIDKFLKKKDIPPSIRVLLRMGVYQLFFTSIPAYAVINETVNMVEHRGFRGLVNAILRRVSEHGYIEPKELYIKYSHPEWLVDYWSSFLPEDYLKDLLRYNLTPAKVVARVNSRKIVRENIKISDISFTKHSPYGIIFNSFDRSPWELEEYKNGIITFQSEASQIIPLIIEFNKGENILDTCAAPGGKATHILELADVNLFVNDISFQKIEIVRKQMERLGFKAKYTVSDARKIKEKYGKIFDKILVDAPCSGFGTIRKNPEVVRRQNYASIKKLSILQKEILDATWSLLKEGGELIYATCTITKEENTEVASWLFKEKKAEVVDIRKKLDNYGVRYLWDGFGALFYPEEVLTPFYVSVFKK